jgi:hypothetical protein
MALSFADCFDAAISFFGCGASLASIGGGPKPFVALGLSQHYFSDTIRLRIQIFLAKRAGRVVHDLMI